MTAAVVEYTTSLGQKRGGVCTSWLAEREEGQDTIPIFVRQSTFRLPPRARTPMIMVGPGTGVAPFRGFIQVKNRKMRIAG